MRVVCGWGRGGGCGLGTRLGSLDTIHILDINFSIKKGTELNRCKKYGNKSVHLIITSIIIRCTHAGTTTGSVLSLQITICNDTDGDHNNGATIQSCSGAWVCLIIKPQHE